MNFRFWGIVLWLFAFNVFAATSGGLLAKYIWLEVVTAIGLFSVASYFLGRSLSWKDQVGYVIMLMFIVVASAMLTLRVNGHLPYPWYDTMTIVAAPQMLVMVIGFWLANRRDLAETGASA